MFGLAQFRQVEVAGQDRLLDVHHQERAEQVLRPNGQFCGSVTLKVLPQGLYACTDAYKNKARKGMETSECAEIRGF